MSDANPEGVPSYNTSQSTGFSLHKLLILVLNTLLSNIPVNSPLTDIIYAVPSGVIFIVLNVVPITALSGILILLLSIKSPFEFVKATLILVSSLIPL